MILLLFRPGASFIKLCVYKGEVGIKYSEYINRFHSWLKSPRLQLALAN